LDPVPIKREKGEIEQLRQLALEEKKAFKVKVEADMKIREDRARQTKK